MKKTFLFAFVLLASLCYSQTPINDYTNNTTTDYYIVTAPSGIDHTANGANVTWNFSTLAQSDSNNETYAAPTSGQSTTYPGTTSVMTLTTASSPSTPNNLYLKNVANEISLTGASNSDLDINYSTDNATLGTFPLNYNYSNTDNVAGTFNYSGTSGTFAGTFATFIDAYGTLNINDLGSGAYSGSVTRMRTEQNITLTVGIFSGTVTQTSYNYYDDSTGKIVFRSSTTNFSIPILGINDTAISNEAINDPTLSTTNFENNSNIAFYPNPVKDILTINTTHTEISFLEIYDLNGRRILSIAHPQNQISLATLNQGIYLTKMYSSKGIQTKKIIKQ
jgi:hypothetical protein